MKIKEAQYAKTLYALTKDKSPKEIDGAISGFLKLLIKNGQTKLTKKIIEKFNDIWNEEEGITEAQVITRSEIEKGELRKIEDYIKERYKTEKVVIKSIMDESIKGGIIIKVKDEILDGSIAGQLKSLKNNLSK